MHYEFGGLQPDQAPPQGIPRPYDYEFEPQLEGKIPDTDKLPNNVTPINKNVADNQVLSYSPARQSMGEILDQSGEFQESLEDSEREITRLDIPVRVGGSALSRILVKIGVDTDDTHPGTRVHKKAPIDPNSLEGRRNAALKRLSETDAPTKLHTRTPLKPKNNADGMRARVAYEREVQKLTELDY